MPPSKTTADTEGPALTLALLRHPPPSKQPKIIKTSLHTSLQSVAPLPAPVTNRPISPSLDQAGRGNLLRSTKLSRPHRERRCGSRRRQHGSYVRSTHSPPTDKFVVTLMQDLLVATHYRRCVNIIHVSQTKLTRCITTPSTSIHRPTAQHAHRVNLAARHC